MSRNQIKAKNIVGATITQSVVRGPGRSSVQQTVMAGNISGGFSQTMGSSTHHVGGNNYGVVGDGGVYVHQGVGVARGASTFTFKGDDFTMTTAQGTKKRKGKGTKSRPVSISVGRHTVDISSGVVVTTDEPEGEATCFLHVGEAVVRVAVPDGAARVGVSFTREGDVTWVEKPEQA